MIWLLVLLIVAVAGVLVGVAVWGGHPGFWKRAVAAAAVLALLVVPLLFFWKYLAFGLTIGSLLAIGIAAALGQVGAAKAIGRAMAVIAICIVLIWLAIQLADPLLFDKESGLSKAWNGLGGGGSGGGPLGVLFHSQDPVISLIVFGILVVAGVGIVSMALQRKSCRPH